MNQTEIIMEFCVNKNKPELQCNGKCHLAKQLDFESKPDVTVKTKTKKREVPRAKMRIQEETLFSNVCDLSIFKFSFKTRKEIDFHKSMNSEKHLLNILQPPIV